MSKKDRAIPEGSILHPDYNEKMVTSRKYKHWTVGTLLEMLADYPKDSRVWISRYEDDDSEIDTIRPIEIISGLDGEVYLN